MPIGTGKTWIARWLGTEGMTIITSRNLRAARLAAVLPLVLAAACGDDDGGGDTSAGASNGDGADGSGAEIVSPADGDAVDPDFDLELSSAEEIGEPDTGNFHYHVFIDGDEDDVEMVYSDSHTVERDLEEGEHTVEAALANPDHSLVDGAARDEITITVGDADSGGGTEDDESDDGGIDY